MLYRPKCNLSGGVPQSSRGGDPLVRGTLKQDQLQDWGTPNRTSDKNEVHPWTDTHLWKHK